MALAKKKIWENIGEEMNTNGYKTRADDKPSRQ
jgi:hypothetical protein